MNWFKQTAPLDELCKGCSAMSDLLLPGICLDLLGAKKLGPSVDGVAVSFFNIYSVVGLLMGGAGTTCLTELKHVLKCADEKDMRERLLATKQLAAMSEDCFRCNYFVMPAAQRCKLSNSYTAWLKGIAAILPIDTSSQKAASQEAKRVNNLIQKETEIGDLVPDDVLKNPDFQCLLLGTVKFKGKFVADDKFDAKMTTKMPFNRMHPQAEKNVDTMKLAFCERNYYETMTHQFLKLRFGVSNWCIIFVRPKSNANNSESIRNGQIPIPDGNAFVKRDMKKVQIPKRKIVGDLIPVHTYLQNKGVKNIFDDHLSDFSPMLQPGSKPIKVSCILHKAIIEWDEIGATASAATAVGMLCAASASSPPKPVEFVCSDPFGVIIGYTSPSHSFIPVFTAAIV